MKPLIIGMGPSPLPELQDMPWHPLAAASRNLSKIIFDDWAAFPRVEEAFELVNLNKRCHQVQDKSGRARDCVDPAQAEQTLNSLKQAGAFAPGRSIFLLGGHVAQWFFKFFDPTSALHVQRLQHPAILGIRKFWPKNPNWRTEMRQALAKSIGLEAQPFDSPVDPPALQWADFEKADWFRYALRYDVKITKDEWDNLIVREGRFMPALTAADIDALDLVDRYEIPNTEHDERVADLVSDGDDYARSKDEGWFYADN